MALTINYESNSGVQGTYLNIQNIARSYDVDRGNESIITARIYLSPEARANGKQPIDTVYHNVPEVFSFEVAYTELKLIYENAIDC